jgi:hypothetical protein
LADDYVKRGELFVPTSMIDGVQDDEKVLEMPVIPETFLEDLKSWSLSETGRPDQFRVGWEPKNGNYLIEMSNGDGTWAIILHVHDVDKATRQQLRPFRPLDNRVFEDLMTTSLVRRFGTGRGKQDWELHNKEMEAARNAAKAGRSAKLSERLNTIADNAAPLFARIRKEHEYGHSHGARMVFSAWGKAGAAEA